MKSILYVWLPCEKIYPLGVLYIANYIHRHRPVRQRILDLSLVDKDSRQKVLEETISAFAPEIIAFSWRDIQIFLPHERDPSLKYAFDFYYSYNPFKKLWAALNGLWMVAGYHSTIRENISYVRLACTLLPEGTIIVGGGAFSVFAEELKKELPERVIGVIGEGEETMLKVLDGKELSGERILFHQKSEIIKNEDVPAMDLSGVELNLGYLSSIFPHHHFYQGSTIGVKTKRGCPQLCTFCLYSYIEGRQVLYRQPEFVVKEVSDIHRTWGMRNFWFADAQFIPEKKAIPHCSEILERMIAEKLDVAWSGYIRTHMVTPELARLMVKSGLGDSEISITSGSQKVIDGLKMGFQLEELYQGCRYLAEAGFKGKVLLNYSLNAPGETAETLRESVASYKRIAGIFGEAHVHPMVFFLAVQPHTQLERDLIESGYLAADYNPIALNPWSIKKLLYNPPPLNKIIARACLSAWKKGGENIGKEIFLALEKTLS